MSWRDLYCGELRSEHIGRRMTVAGWADTRRDHGGLVFVDLRDHTGKLQLVINPERAPDAAGVAHELRNEFVLQAEGEVVARAPEAVNPNLPTGEVEVQVDRLTILSRSTPLPFQLDEENVDEVLRLKYRWLDLRREHMQSNIRRSHKAIGGVRRTMDELGFVDVWTPSMTRGTPEGARDFLVPVRLQPGTFFALAQSPQLFKQLCMVGGIDRYYQIATCWRDEDLRADRQFEFRQLDLEMAFVEAQEVLDVMEAAVVGAFEAVGATPPPRPFPQIGYDEAMAKYGSDKPDLRFDLEIQDATDVTRDSEFGVFKNAPCVRYVVAPKAFSRGDLAKLEELVKSWGAKGLAYLVREDGETRSPIAKFLSARELDAFASEDGTTVLFGAGDEAAVARVLGLLRLHLGRELDLVDEDAQLFHWIVDFPLFEQDEDTGQWTFTHHPFTAPAPGVEGWDEANPGDVRGQHYDLIWNGWELGSGSIRIHDVDMQQRVFRTMGLSEEEAQSKFGFLLEALAMGAPPHGGFAMGIDRFVARLVGEPDIRQVIAFPKVASGDDPLTGAPTPMPEDVLRELGIKSLPQDD
ncbi:MAG TPA: aspartate--tRNA ligase [Gaiellaceae bacterium]|jgi:aspartyl-tRNA synthetase|nr:aspartate--tRNA ligase [Gaiellaceae bacterium]